MSKARRLSPALLIVTFLALGALYSLITPVFETPDEVWHFAHVRYIAQHRDLPVQGANQGEESAQQEASQPPLYYVLASPLVGIVDTSDFAEVARANPFAALGQPHSDGNKNAVVPSPSTFPWYGTALAVHLTRLLSVLFSAITVAAAYAAGLTIFTGRQAPPGIAFPPVLFALATAALVAFNPQFAFISASVSNDSLMTALGALTLAIVASMVSAPALPSRRRLALLGVLAGLAALCKLSGLLVACFVLAALLVVALLHRTERPASATLRWLAGATIIVGGLAMLIAGWWYIRNLLLYGDLTGLSAMLQWVGTRTMSLADIAGESQGLELSFWGVFGWFNVLMDQGVYRVLQAVDRLALIGLAAWAALRMAQRTTVSVNARALAAAALWLAVVLAGLARWTATTPGTQGRLLFPAISAVAALLVTGLATLLPARLRAPGLTLLATCLLFLAAAAPFRYIMPAYALPPVVTGGAQPQHPASITYGDDEIALLGYDASSETITPASTLTVTLYMQALRPMSSDYSLFIHVWGADMQWIGQRDSYPGRGSLPTHNWPAGTTIADRYLVSIAPTATVPARAILEVGFYDYDSGSRLVAAREDGARTGLPIAGQLRLSASAPSAQPLQPALASFGDQINLAGADVKTPPELHAGSVISVMTTWQAVAPCQVDYLIFLQIIDQKPSLVAQNDGPPQNGWYPTSLWQAGEIVSDRRTLTLPATIPNGTYRLVVGLYDLASGQRLNATGAAASETDDWATLDEITIR
jgi:hypothetical protein